MVGGREACVARDFSGSDCARNEIAQSRATMVERILFMIWIYGAIGGVARDGKCDLQITARWVRLLSISSVILEALAKLVYDEFVGRLCQTPSNVESSGVSQKRPTTPTTTAARSCSPFSLAVRSRCWVRKSGLSRRRSQLVSRW